MSTTTKRTPTLSPAANLNIVKQQRKTLAFGALNRSHSRYNKIFGTRKTAVAGLRSLIGHRCSMDGEGEFDSEDIDAQHDPLSRISIGHDNKPRLSQSSNH